MAGIVAVMMAMPVFREGMRAGRARRDRQQREHRQKLSRPVHAGPVHRADPHCRFHVRILHASA